MIPKRLEELLRVLKDFNLDSIEEVELPPETMASDQVFDELRSLAQTEGVDYARLALEAIAYYLIVRRLETKGYNPLALKKGEAVVIDLSTSHLGMIGDN